MRIDCAMGGCESTSAGARRPGLDRFDHAPGGRRIGAAGRCLNASGLVTSTYVVPSRHGVYSLRSTSPGGEEMHAPIRPCRAGDAVAQLHEPPEVVGLGPRRAAHVEPVHAGAMGLPRRGLARHRTLEGRYLLWPGPCPNNSKERSLAGRSRPGTDVEQRLHSGVGEHEHGSSDLAVLTAAAYLVDPRRMRIGTSNGRHQARLTHEWPADAGVDGLELTAATSSLRHWAGP